MTPPNMTLRRPAKIGRLIEDVLRFHGAIPSDAETQATHLVEAELRGHPSHGLRRVPILAGRLDAGLIVSGTTPHIEQIGPASALIDGRLGFGPVVGSVAIESVIERASEHGIAIASIHNSGHLGMLAPYVEKMAERGFIGVALTTSEALVHAWGGTGPIVGTNPIAIAVPSATSPVVLDMSVGAVSRGKINDFAARDEDIPPTWGINDSGSPTTDPSQVDAISPFGGAKGYALGLAIEVLVASLTHTALGLDVRGTLDAEHPVTKGDVFICIAPTGDADAPNRVTRYLNTVRASGHDVSIPGDRSRRSRGERIGSGIDVDDALWAEVEALK